MEKKGFFILFFMFFLLLIEGCAAKTATGGFQATTGRVASDVGGISDVGISPSTSDASASDALTRGTLIELTPVDGSVKIPLNEVSASLKKYSYTVGGVQIRYFVVAGSDGMPRVAFDTCSVCKSRGRYEKDGSTLKCAACGQSFSIDKIGTANKGDGCFPTFLPFKAEAGNIVIDSGSIEAGKELFA